MGELEAARGLGLVTLELRGGAEVEKSSRERSPGELRLQAEEVLPKNSLTPSTVCFDVHKVQGMMFFRGSVAGLWIFSFFPQY